MPGKQASEFDMAIAQEEAVDRMLDWEETSVSHAGVMRCCVESLGDYFDNLVEGQEVAVGTKVACNHVPATDKNHGFTLIDRGTWIASWIADKEDVR